MDILMRATETKIRFSDTFPMLSYYKNVFCSAPLLSGFGWELTTGWISLGCIAASRGGKERKRKAVKPIIRFVDPKFPTSETWLATPA